jgi:hypothetical protein
MGAAEICQPIVIYAQHLRGSFVVTESHTCAEDAIEDFSLNAVTILILQTQLRVGETSNALAAVVVQPGRCHAVGTMNLTRYIFAPGRSHAIGEAETRTILGNPMQTLPPLDHVRHPILKSGGCIGSEQVGR